MANRGSGGISYEPCTLVYTLLTNEFLDFEDFYLLVRSLHTFMVEAVTPNPELQNVHVRLNYQASIANAIAKLGDLQGIISVTKLSAFVQESELSRLEDIKRRFNIGPGAAETEQPPPVAPKKTYKKRGAGGQIFGQRPAPYLRRSTPPAGVGNLPRFQLPTPQATTSNVSEELSPDDYSGHDPTDQ